MVASKEITQSRIPLAEPDLRGNELKYLADCVHTNWVSSAGSYVTGLEAQMAELCRRNEGVATVNGTAALYLALRVMDVGPGDQVIVPDFTFAATANAVLQTGAEPVFVDVAADCWCLDPQLTVETLTDYDIKAIMAVHTLGHPADIDPIVDAANSMGIPLIEDAAGAVGALYKGQPVGSFGDAAIFSFNGNKTVTAGGGGMIVLDDMSLAARARALSAQSRKGPGYCYDEIANNLRMTNLNAAVGVAQLERLKDMLAAKRTIAMRYDRTISGRDDLQPMPRTDWADSACWLYSVRCASRDDATSLVEACVAEQIEARTFWEGLSAQAPYSGFKHNLNGTTEKLSGTIVSLPCSTNLSVEDQERVINVIADWSGTGISVSTAS